MKIERKKNLRMAILLGLTLFAMGCGSSEEEEAPPAPNQETTQAPAPQPAAPAAPAPQTPAPSPSNTPNYSNCPFVISMVSGVNNEQIKQFDYGCSWAMIYSVPVLNPNNKSGSQAVNTGIRVQPSDVVTFSASGKWGVDEDNVDKLENSNQVGDWDNDEKDMTADGIRHGIQMKYQGMNAAILGTDGTEVFVLGSNATVEIKNTGFLKVGLNTPSGVDTLSTLYVNELRVRHCETMAGVTVVCP